jgi:hypothetical protein
MNRNDPKYLRIRTVRRAWAAFCATVGLMSAPVFSPALAPGRKESPTQVWARTIAPLLDRKCVKCHAGVNQYGGLDLRSIETMLRGGDHGPAIIPGRPAESRILSYVQPGSDPHMPPDAKKQLSPEEIGALKSWVAMLPAPRSPLASASSRDNSWVPDYLAEYRRIYHAPRVPPANLAPSAVVDWFLQADWRDSGIRPAKNCDDATFVRRIYLDLAGRIPTREEREQFLTDRVRDRRSRLVEKLLASDDYSRSMGELFDTVLMGRPANRAVRERTESGWNAFLEDAFRANRPWSETVRDMLLARGGEGARRGAVQFIAEKKDSHQAIAEAVAPVVFGVQIKCAQCHNHPLVWEIEQRHYWGLVAVFNRSKNVRTASGTGVSESAVGGFIKFANLKKESQPAALVFLNGKSVAERMPGPDEKEVDSPDLYVVPPAGDGEAAKAPAIPRFSRREAFADAVTRDNPMLARAFVNRMWAYFMGRGLVHPVDQMDSRHPASHPDLLDWLAKDFEKSGYDVRRLARILVSTRAYRLDSNRAGATALLPETFARYLEKPLTAEQLIRSIWVAAGNKEFRPSEEMKRAFVNAYPDVMADNPAPSLQLALLLTNSPLVAAALKPASDNTADRLRKLGSPDAVVREAFVTVLGRLPDPSEAKECAAIVGEKPSAAGVENLLWALVASAEFKVNH